MLLHEILKKAHPDIKKSSAPMTSRKNPMYYKPNKWNDVGIGQQSSVFSHDKHSDKVIKLTLAMDNQRDPAYQFLRLCLSHQDNPFFPKIHKIKRYPTGGETALLISMERLIPLTDQDFEHLQQLMGVPFVPEPKDSIEMVTGGLFNSFTKPGVRQFIMKNTKNPDLSKALRLLEPLFRHYGPDMHMGNIMKRSNGQIVIMDPITYG